MIHVTSAEHQISFWVAMPCLMGLTQSFPSIGMEINSCYDEVLLSDISNNGDETDLCCHVRARSAWRKKILSYWKRKLKIIFWFHSRSAMRFDVNILCLLCAVCSWLENSESQQSRDSSNINIWLSFGNQTTEYLFSPIHPL